MNIISDYRNDLRHLPHHSGGYEWWYFDGVSSDGKFSFVIIFYEGNPFSTRYNQLLQEPGPKPMPSEYPAVSISIYEQGEPIYYSFTEFKQQDCSFSSDWPLVKIGRHSMELIESDQLCYQLTMDEQLPSGESLYASIRFKSEKNKEPLFTDNMDHQDSSHQWNLVQPRAEVEGEIEINKRSMNFDGNGYHDHNTGQEPLWDEFTEWYWGRFHFEVGTLVYYVMNKQQSQQHQAWLIEKENKGVLNKFDDILLEDKGFSLFGLKSARKVKLHSKQIDVHIQQSKLLDNGPFYQRYMGDGFLRVDGNQRVEATTGITEYIYPSRINNRFFWPLLEMRIRYRPERPHWVQKSKMMYRWTW